MKILVTGAGGMLGSALVPGLAAAGHDVRPTDLLPSRKPAWATALPELMLEKLDVRSAEEIGRSVADVRPDLIMHLAAETDVEVCDARSDHAWQTNALGTKHVALACRRADRPVVYISTAGVFDGKKEEPYVEFDAAYPINYYGRSKLQGERYVSEFLPQHYIIRAGWMVGGGVKDHKFVAKMLEQIDGGARTLYAVGDKLGTPTYAPDFAACLTQLITTESFGLYHMACQGRASRYDVARKILAVLGREDVELVEVSSDYFKDSYPTPRPRSEMMRNLMLDLQGWNTMRPWEVALEEYLTSAFADLRVTTSR
jgi:dTDP-4-dehydrorhamnose reductase